MANKKSINCCNVIYLLLKLRSLKLQLLTKKRFEILAIANGRLARTYTYLRNFLLEAKDLLIPRVTKSPSNYKREDFWHENTETYQLGASSSRGNSLHVRVGKISPNKLEHLLQGKQVLWKTRGFLKAAKCRMLGQGEGKRDYLRSYMSSFLLFPFQSSQLIIWIKLSHNQNIFAMFNITFKRQEFSLQYLQILHLNHLWYLSSCVITRKRILSVATNVENSFVWILLCIPLINSKLFILYDYNFHILTSISTFLFQVFFFFHFSIILSFSTSSLSFTNSALCNI